MYIYGDFCTRILSTDRQSAVFIDKGDELITGKRIEPAYRGVITDREGAPLAANAPLYTVFFDPYAYAEEYYRLDNEIKPPKVKPPNKKHSKTQRNGLG